MFCTPYFPQTTADPELRAPFFPPHQEKTIEELGYVLLFIYYPVYSGSTCCAYFVPTVY